MPGLSRARVTADVVRAHRMFGLAGRRRKLPRQQPPMALEREYARAIVELVRPRLQRALAPLMSQLPGILARAAAARKVDHMDAGEGKELSQLVDAARQHLRGSISTSEIEALAEKFAARTATYQRVQLARQTTAALGVDVFASDRKIPTLVDHFVAENIALIKDIGDKVASRVGVEVTRAVASGELHGDLAEKLQAIGYGETRAALIARDQVGKLYGQINATRQQELGVDKFIWRTVGDERVRDEHESLDGEEFSYAAGGHPTEGMPGEPILCRCWAEPVFDAIADDVAETPDVPEPEPIKVAPEPERAPPFPEHIAAPIAFEPAPIAIAPAPASVVAELAPAAIAEVAPIPEIPEPVEFVMPKNPKRVEAAKKAAAASAERRREVHSAVATNLPQELQVAWQSEGHKFMREEAGRVRGIKDRINVASELSQAFAEKYGAGEASAFGNEGDRFQKRAELEAKHAEEWASAQERDYYEAARKEMIENGEIDEDGNPTTPAHHEPAEPDKWSPISNDDDEPPF